MSYQAVTFSFQEIPSASKMNQLGQNDAAFNDGTGLPSAGSKTANVATEQGTSSGTPVDLATVGPSVTVTIGATGMALVFLQSVARNTTGESVNLYYVVSGATTVAATSVLAFREPDANNRTVLGHALVTGLNAGSNTFKMQYATSGGGTSYYSARVISVIPI